MLNVKNLSVSYDNKLIINNINFSTPSGTIVGIIGPNGAGKSTLIKAMLYLLKSSSGLVTYNDEVLSKQLKKIAYMPQRNNIDWNFPVTVLDVVLMGLFPKYGLFKRTKSADREEARCALKRVGMLEFENRQIGKLSGGQQQRVFLARSLVQDAEVLFLDEPFVGIDNKTEGLIIKILKELRDDGKIIYIIHHDLSKAIEYFDEIIILNKEIIAMGSVEAVLTEANLNKAFNFNFSKVGNGL